VVRKQHVADTDGRAFVLSDETPDRMGDIVLSSGWSLRNFLANPIALFAHNSSFPIGTWANLRIKQLRGGDLHLASENTSERVGEVVRLVRAGILKAVSVGFRPLRSKPGKDAGLIFEQQELIECSLCAVPANPAALCPTALDGLPSTARRGRRATFSENAIHDEDCDQDYPRFSLPWRSRYAWGYRAGCRYWCHLLSGRSRPAADGACRQSGVLARGHALPVGVD
jgi:HK97 family phage prohead protease